MHFFIDEAGDFNVPPQAREHRVSVAAGLAFTDDAWRSTALAFEKFKAGLGSHELYSGEPKWHLLTPAHRLAFTGLLNRRGEVSFTPVILDLSHLADVRNSWAEPMLRKLEAEAELMVFDTAKEDVRVLSKQARNLNSVQFLRLYVWAWCLRQALYHAIIFLASGSRASSWEAVSIEIDPVQRRPKSRERQVFSIMVLAWLAGWSRSRPYITVKEVHSPIHPFVRNFDTPEGVDLGKLVRPNLRWPDSKASAGLQIADLAAAAVYCAASELPSRENLGDYVGLMEACHYMPDDRPGLISPLTTTPAWVGAKYEALVP